MSDVDVTPVAALPAGDVAAVLALARDAEAVDGVRPLSEQTELALRRADAGAGRHLLARGTDGDVAGYARVDADAGDGATAELVVHPARRRQGVGRALLAAVESTAGTGRLQVWAHGGHPGAAALAASRGYRAGRSLWVMRRPLTGDLPAVTVPDGVRLRPFRPGEDDETWVAVNAAAFAAHPEQGAMTLRDLRERMAEPWFDPEGFLVAEDAATGEMLGFHWTKVHRHSGGGAVGEVYVVGVSPSAQGLGLGRVLTLAGLHHLSDIGLRHVMLYVEADNAPALAVYSALGFTHDDADTDVLYTRP
ncbi:MAG: mycothiol synthase [Actinomycetes bacterium]